MVKSLVEAWDSDQIKFNYLDVYNINEILKYSFIHTCQEEKDKQLRMNFHHCVDVT